MRGTCGERMKARGGKMWREEKGRFRRGSERRKIEGRGFMVMIIFT